MAEQKITIQSHFRHTGKINSNQVLLGKWFNAFFPPYDFLLSNNNTKVLSECQIICSIIYPNCRSILLVQNYLNFFHIKGHWWADILARF